MEGIVDRYWKALGSLDPEGMAACYAGDASFRDPVFDLRGEDIGRMWVGLFTGAKDLRVETEPLRVEGDRIVGTWRASYTFSATGRKVHNVIRSSFRVRDGLIVEQRDRFPFWKWSRMALGLPGLLLGWTPMLRNKVRRTAAKRLE